MDRKVVFISYSHDSPEHRERVLGLAVSLRQDGIVAVLDQYLNGSPENGWPRWMLDQIEKASRVLVVCTETYYRRFRGHEEAGKGKGGDWEGMVITQELYDSKSGTNKFVPVLFEAGDEAFIPEPLRGRTFYLLASQENYQVLYDDLMGQAGVEEEEIGEVKVRERRKGAPLVFKDEIGTTGAQRINPSKLPPFQGELFGREERLEDLDQAWSDPKVNVITLVAWGGVGKTSLIAKWAASLAAQSYNGADYFDWTFYSQGTKEDRIASSDTFFTEALTFFGDPDLAASAASPWDKGKRLAELVAQHRSLLILDGLEPLQYPPGPLAGELKDPALATLLKSLAQKNSGLCVVTTRESVKDLATFVGSTAPEWELERLSVPAGAKLLESLGVYGAKAEIEELVEDVKGHALTLHLLGSYLARAHGGDVRRRDRIDLQKADLKVKGGHAFKAMAAYERWFDERGEEGARQLAILRLLGLFDRPADPDCLEALRRPPVISGLTEPLAGLEEEDWNFACSALREARLLASPPPASGRSGAPIGASTLDPLDAHPLLREYFAQRLREEQSEAWRAAHSRLYEHLRDTTEHRPDTLEGLQPLYQAITHGCQAGRQQEACDEIYKGRILRGTKIDGFHSTKTLGAVGADLGAVTSFFESPWNCLLPALTRPTQAWLLNEAGLRLRALGRLTEALAPMRAGLEMLIAQENWTEAATNSSNLSELELALDEVPAAIKSAKQSEIFASRSPFASQRMARRTTQADALHQAGRQTEALELFCKAERRQAEYDAAKPLLYSLRGFQYCDLLLAEPERTAWRGKMVGAELAAQSRTAQKVEERVKFTIEIAVGSRWLLGVAFDHLTLGRIHLYRSILEGGDLALADPEVEKAVAGLRGAGRIDYLPRGLLTRAWLRTLQGNPSAAQADLDEAQEIAERGPMPLHLADIALYRARLFRDREALATARRLIEKHGYWRRKEELEDAEEMAAGWPKPRKSKATGTTPPRRRAAKVSRKGLVPATSSGSAALGNFEDSESPHPPRAKPPALTGALALWQSKLAFLLGEEAKVYEPSAKFKLRHDIAEAREKIRELGGEA